MDEDDAKGVADLRAKGMTVIDNVDKAKFQAALAPVNAEFEKQFGKANIDKIRNSSSSRDTFATDPRVERWTSRLSSWRLRHAGRGQHVAALFQIITRFVLEQPAEWTEILIRFRLIWMVFLGIPIAFRQGAMVSVDVLYRWSPADGQPRARLGSSRSAALRC